MGNVSLMVAFTAGLLSFFSPCVFPLIPAFVSHLTGADVNGNKIHAGKRMLIIRSIWFILGFSTIFIAMGASASFIGGLLAGHRGLIQKMSGLFIIIFGMQMARILNIRALMMDKRWNEGKIRGKGSFSSFLLGLAFGTGWTPCVGLALSSILLLAGSADTLDQGIFLLAVYSLGMGIPFLIIAVLITYSLNVVRRLNRVLPVLSLVNGWIMIGMGLLLFTGQFQKLSPWLAQITF